MQITIGLDKRQYKSKPDNIDVAAIKARLTDNGNITVEPSSLPDFIKNGYTFCPAEVEPTLNEKGKLSHRAEGWRSQRLFCVDIDNADKSKQKLTADKYIPCDKAIEICQNHGIKLLFVYNTFSSRWGFDKYRLVVLLDETVTSPEERFKIVTAFMELFGDASDKSCINGDRIFFAGKSFPVPYTGKTTPKQVFLDLYDKSHPKTTTTATLSPSKPLNFSPPSSGVGNTYSPSDFDANPDTLLQMIDPNALQYDEWLGVTASYKAAGGSYEVWAAWSATYHNANARTDAQAWKGLTGDKHTVGTLKHFAREHSPSLYDDYIQDLAAEQNTAIKSNAHKKQKATAPAPEPPTADEEYPFILSDKKRRWLDCITLADYIREKLPYFFVRREGSENYRRYVYHKGVYRLISDIEFQGYIKAFICKADKSLLKMKDVREVYSMLITDLDRCKVREEMLNSDENIINFKNGILHLDTMTITPHSPSILSTIQLPVTYTGDVADTPLFDKFINEFTCGNAEKQQALLEFIGACLSNVYGWRFKTALFCIGDGNSGKSVLREFANRLLGADNISGGGLDYLESRFGKLALHGKRVYGSPDVGYVTLNQLETFKNITGGDTIPIEAKGKDSFEYQYRGMVWFGGNAMPKFGGDRGDWVYDRMLLIKCNNVVPPEKRDKQLINKLLSEAEGIIHKAIIALKEAIERGYLFTVPAESATEIEKFKVENSPYLRFYEECCVPRSSNDRFDNVTTAKLHKALKAWCLDNTGGLTPKTADFAKELEQNGIKMDVAIYSGNRYYKTFTLSKEYKELNNIFDTIQ